MHLLLVITLPAGFFSVLAWSAAWGYVASWLNEFIKQDGWPKAANTVIANLVVLIGAAFTTLLTSPGSTLTWSLFVTALLGSFQAALINHQFFLEPTGIGPRIQTATSAVKASPPPPA